MDRFPTLEEKIRQLRPEVGEIKEDLIGLLAIAPQDLRMAGGKARLILENIVNRVLAGEQLNASDILYTNL